MQSQNELTINDIPYLPWIAGVIFLGGTLYGILTQGFSAELIFLGLIGLAILLLPRGVTITANRNTRILRLESWSLYLIGSVNEIRFDEIAEIRLSSRKTGNKRGRTTFAYRIEVVKRNETIIPFRTAFSSGSKEKQEVVDKISAFIGIDK